MRGVFGTKEPFEIVKAACPEPLVVAKPFGRLRERLRLETADVRAPSNLAPDQPSGFQRLDVLGRGCERHVEGIGQFGDGPFAGGEPSHHLTTRRISKRVKDLVEMRC